jgi:hypothetical protein
MTQPLFDGECAAFVAAEFRGTNPRSAIARLHARQDPAQRKAIRDEILRFTEPAYGQTATSATPYTLVYRQEIRHPRLAQAERHVELWRTEPRARVTLRFDRLSSEEPEVLYAGFAVPRGTGMPVLSNGGVPFTPYADQLRGSCSDYYSIDGWAKYGGGNGHTIWITEDAPLVSIGGPQTLQRRTDPPADAHRIGAVLFDNCWHTNFVADSHGKFEFRFDLVWRADMFDPAELAESVAFKPVVVLNPAGRMSEALERNLYG